MEDSVSNSSASCRINDALLAVDCLLIMPPIGHARWPFSQGDVRLTEWFTLMTCNLWFEARLGPLRCATHRRFFGWTF